MQESFNLDLKRNWNVYSDGSKVEKESDNISPMQNSEFLTLVIPQDSKEKGSVFKISMVNMRKIVALSVLPIQFCKVSGQGDIKVALYFENASKRASNFLDFNSQVEAKIFMSKFQPLLDQYKFD